YGLRGKYQFDIISLNVGSSGLFGGGDVDALIQIPAKPFSGFVQSWARWRERILSTKLPRQLLVVGGGAAGVELAFALAAFARSAPALAGSVVTLATQEASVLNDMDPAIQERVSRSLRERGVIIFPKLHFLGTETDVARFSGGKAMKTDLVIVATGSRPFPWLAESARRGGISLGANQALLIEKNLKVRGAFGVFAAGDCAEISGEPLPRSGVHALRQGDVLGRNLLAMSRNPQSS
ncbi:MAG: FAD-dependent oxidoreductase, partial [Quisquiliibacterium sp.]